MTDAPEPLAEPDEPVSGGTANDVPRQFRRSANGKLIAGVARGLSNRFDLDANIFRVIFVLLTLFWGLGIVIYLVLWVFVPRAEGEVSTAHIRPSVSNSHRLPVALAIGLVVLALLVVMLSHGRAIAYGGPSLALTWLVFLVALAVVALRTPARRLTVRRFFAVTFLVGLSGVIVLIGVIMGFVASTGVALAGGNGAHTWQPTTLGDVQHRYATEFGSTTLDLQAVTFPASGYDIKVSTAIGPLWVTVPANAVVSVTTHVGLGPVYLQGSPDGRPFTSAPTGGISTGSPSRAPHLSIDALVGIGRIDIVRATATALAG